MHDAPAGHGKPPNPPHVLPAAHSPFACTAMPCEAAIVPFQYVTPSHPQAGARIGSSVVPMGLHVPIPHPGASQYMPAPQGSVAFHWHVAPPELLLLVLDELLLVLDALLLVLDELLVLELLLVLVLDELLVVLEALLLPPPLPLDVDEEPPVLDVSTPPPQAASATSHATDATKRRGSTALTADPGSAWRAPRPLRRAPWPRRRGCAASRRARG